MLKTEKKIASELKRLEKYLYDDVQPLGSWKVRKAYYQGPDKYEFVDTEAFEWREGVNIGEPDITVFAQNDINLDAQYKGKKTVLLLKMGGEGCVSINGKRYNGLDFNRDMILLVNSALGNEKFHVDVEVFCRDLILDSQNVFSNNLILTKSNIATVNEPVWKLYYDLKNSFEFAVDFQESYSREKLLTNLYGSLVQLRYTSTRLIPESIFVAQQTYDVSMKSLQLPQRPVTMYFAGHSHIDVAWHWPLKETVRKVSRTFSTALRLMEQYPAFTFSQSMPVLYEMAKKYYPDIYKQIKKRITENRWETLGCMYLEPDCNLVSGESFVRQILFGKQFFQTEFGTDSDICFIPDTFGYSPAMPQIIKKSGAKYFFTTKLTWNDTNEFPYSIFKWKGLDGTEVLSGMMSMFTQEGIGLYNGDASPKGINGSLEYFKNKDLDVPVLYLYGHGDGGGGVTPKMLETVTRMNDTPLTPKAKIGFVRDYFEALDETKDYPVWDGELYFEKHRGTYTTGANNKKNNRKSEFLYRRAELLSVVDYLKTKHWQNDDLHTGWKLILLNQFHDILPGTCIAPVYELCDRQYKEIKTIGENSIEANVRKLVDQEGSAITVFNTLSWKRSQVVSIQAKKGQHILDFDGNLCPQSLGKDGEVYFLADAVPGIGYKTYFLQDVPATLYQCGKLPFVWNVEEKTLETQWYTVQFNELGEMTRLFDTKVNREILKDGTKGNVMKLLDDIPVEWHSAWETTTMRDDKPSAPFVSVAFSYEANELFAKLEVKKLSGNSTIVQEIYFYHHSSLIRFSTRVDWDECQKILRVAFPVTINSLTATYDVAFGNIERPNHMSSSFDQAKFEVCAHKWADLSETNYGVALLNESKYGYSIQNSDIQLSLLRSANYPSDSCDKGHHEFSYWLYPHQGTLVQAQVAQQGYEVNEPLMVMEGKISGTLDSFIATDSHNMIIDTVKRSEDGHDVIVRVFETYNSTESEAITFSVPVLRCEECDLLERKIGEISVNTSTINFDLKPFEIKSFRICLE